MFSFCCPCLGISCFFVGWGCFVLLFVVFFSSFFMDRLVAIPVYIQSKPALAGPKTVLILLYDQIPSRTNYLILSTDSFQRLEEALYSKTIPWSSKVFLRYTCGSQSLVWKPMVYEYVSKKSF